MIRILLLYLIAFIFSGCTGSQTAKLTGKLRSELKNKYGIKDGEVVAKFDLAGLSKKQEYLFAPYYGSVVNDNKANKKFLENFESRARTPNPLQQNAYKKISLLNKTLLAVDKKYNLFSSKIKQYIRQIDMQYQRSPSILKKDQTNYIEKLAKLHNATKNIPTFVPLEHTLVTSKFGQRKHPHKNRVIHHSGLDLAGKNQCKIYAAGEGVVELVARAKGYGNMIVIRHTKEVKTRYAHLSKFIVEEGDKVLLGQNIGNQGCSGTATGPHLHFEVIIKNNPVNPDLFIGHSL